MPRTFFQDFNRVDGSSITVKYSFRTGEVEIVEAWPNTPEYNALQNDRYALAEHYFPPLIRGIDPSPAGRIARIDERLAAMEAACKLTDAEGERMCAWLAEHHVDEPDDELCF
jgi:hypothetical protein